MYIFCVSCRPLTIFYRHNEVWFVAKDDPVCPSSEEMDWSTFSESTIPRQLPADSVHWGSDDLNNLLMVLVMVLHKLFCWSFHFNKHFCSDYIGCSWSICFSDLKLLKKTLHHFKSNTVLFNATRWQLLVQGPFSQDSNFLFKNALYVIKVHPHVL